MIASRKRAAAAVRGRRNSPAYLRKTFIVKPVYQRGRGEESGPTHVSACPRPLSAPRLRNKGPSGRHRLVLTFSQFLHAYMECPAARRAYNVVRQVCFSDPTPFLREVRA